MVTKPVEQPAAGSLTAAVSIDNETMTRTSQRTWLMETKLVGARQSTTD